MKVITWLSAARKFTPEKLVSTRLTRGSFFFHWLTRRDLRRRLAGLREDAVILFFEGVITGVIDVNLFHVKSIVKFSLRCPESFLYEGVPFVTNASSPLQGDRVKAVRD